MPLIDKYIIGKLLKTIVFILLVIIAIVVVIDFAEKQEDWFEKEIPRSEVLGYYFYFSIFIADMLSPICIFLSVIMVTAQMSEKSEIIAILSSGTGFFRFLRPYIISAVILALFSYAMKNKFVPTAMKGVVDFNYTYLKDNQDRGRHKHIRISKNTYVYVFMFNEIKQEGDDFVLETFDGNKLTKKLRASEFYWVDSTKSWFLKDIHVREITEKGDSMYTISSLDTVLLLYPDNITQREEFVRSLSYTELNSAIELEQIRGTDLIVQLDVEKHQRIAFPFASLILSFLGVSLAAKKKRGGIAINIGIGLLLTFVYIGMSYTIPEMLRTILDPVFAIWLPNIVFAMLTSYMIIKVPQ